MGIWKSISQNNEPPRPPREPRTGERHNGETVSLRRRANTTPDEEAPRSARKPAERGERKPFFNWYYWSEASPKLIVFSLAIMTTVVFYFLALHIFFSDPKSTPAKPQIVTMKVKPPEKVQEPEREEKPKPPEKIEEKYISKPPATKSQPLRTVRPKEIKTLPASELVALGQSRLGDVKAGQFPSLILNYHDPVNYIRQMYNLGAKTIISINHRYYEINLLGNNEYHRSFSPSDLAGFSHFRRVIDDSVWDTQKIQAASRLGQSSVSCTLLLIVPMNLESKWIGHQTYILQQMGITPNDVQTIEADFRNAKLKLARITLKNGTTKYAPDAQGV
jgi:hypothetical protein